MSRMYSKITPAFIALIIGFVAFLYLIYVAQPKLFAPNPSNNTLSSPAGLQTRGKNLRSAIEEAYQTMERTGSLTTKGNDITSVVLRYIPVGTSFDNAEEILRDAGFEVERRPGPNAQGDRPDKYDVLASIIPFMQSRFSFGSRTCVFVHLTPKFPERYDKVYKLSAFVTFSSL